MSVAHAGALTRQQTADSSPGVVLLDSRMRPLYANTEAVRLLAYPKGPETIKSLSALFMEKIRASGTKSQPPPDRVFVSGRRHYWCRFFALDYRAENSSAPAMTVLMERGRQSATLFPQMAERFHFTTREQEAIQLVVEGLGTKDIAKRMGVSPNTVRAFLHLVMIKMGVGSRSGILGKMIQP